MTELITTTTGSRPAQRRVWIGLVHVMPTEPDLLNGSNAAYVNVLSIARGREDYESSVRAAAHSLGFVVIDFEDVEAFSTRAKKWKMNDEMKQLARACEETGETQFGSFYTYRDETIN